MADQIKFFGAVDRERNDPNGKILSAYPAWYYDEKIDSMENNIVVREHRLKAGLTPTSNIEIEKTELEERKARLKAVKNSKPKLVGRDKDEVAKLYRHLKEQIINRLPSRSDVLKGTVVNIRDEVMWKKKPSIEVSNFVPLCEALGLVMPEKRYISGHQAMLSLKILAKLIGEETNIERLRRDFNNNTYKPEVSVEDLVKQGQAA